jgi:hypothetical protein
MHRRAHPPQPLHPASALLNKREFDEPLPPGLPLLKGKGGGTKKQEFYSPLLVGEGSGERSKQHLSNSR